MHQLVAAPDQPMAPAGPGPDIPVRHHPSRIDPRLRFAIREVVRTVNRPIATLRLRRALRSTTRPTSLEVGGLRPRTGWLVVNVNAVTRHYMDATRPWPIEDGSLSHVYADNMIEHVPLAGGRRFLAEAHRCLRPGGVLRLVTPDVRHNVDLYLAGAPSVASDLAEVYRRYGVDVEHPIDLLRAPIGQFGHHAGYMYDFEALDAELQRAGFGAAERCELGESDHPALVGLDERFEEGAGQLVVEARR